VSDENSGSWASLLIGLDIPSDVRTEYGLTEDDLVFATKHAAAIIGATCPGSCPGLLPDCQGCA